MDMPQTLGDRYYGKNTPYCLECSSRNNKTPLIHYKVKIENTWIDLYQCSKKETLFGFNYDFRKKIASFNLPVLMKLHEEDFDSLENARVYDENGNEAKKLEELIDKING